MGTPGRCDIGGTDGIVYYFSRDFLEKDVCNCSYTSVRACVRAIIDMSDPIRSIERSRAMNATTHAHAHALLIGWCWCWMVGWLVD